MYESLGHTEKRNHSEMTETNTKRATRETKNKRNRREATATNKNA